MFHVRRAAAGAFARPFNLIDIVILVSHRRNVSNIVNGPFTWLWQSYGWENVVPGQLRAENPLRKRSRFVLRRL